MRSGGEMKRRRSPDPAIVLSVQNDATAPQGAPSRSGTYSANPAYLTRSLCRVGPHGSWDGRTPVRGRARAADNSPRVRVLRTWRTACDISMVATV